MNSHRYTPRLEKHIDGFSPSDVKSQTRSVILLPVQNENYFSLVLRDTRARARAPYVYTILELIYLIRRLSGFCKSFNTFAKERVTFAWSSDSFRNKPCAITFPNVNIEIRIARCFIIGR